MRIQFTFTVTAFCFFSVINIHAQKQYDSAFMVFAQQMQQQMNDDNVNSNVDAYLKHYKEYTTALNKLDVKNKNFFQSNITELKYNLACTYAKVGKKNIAYDSLEHSGYQNYEHIISDGDWTKCRQDKRFIVFCNSIKKYSKLGILQSAGKYTNVQSKDIPAFVYQGNSNEHLSALRKKYHLDSIAGTGNDISRFINLLHWVHNIIRHDGSKGYPDGDKTAENFISSCQKNNGTCNCRGLAIVLNEVYLAEGFKSRYVTCLPKDSLDNDCHVITCVYSNSLNKWVWMDPTFDAYVMDEKGTVLSIEEVRERLIKEKPLIINPDANWNHRSSQTEADYLGSYMAKNLYQLECIVNSEYNTETPAPNKNRQFVQLIPSNLSYKKTQVYKGEDGNPSRTVYYTTDAEKFWSKP